MPFCARAPVRRSTFHVFFGSCAATAAAVAAAGAAAFDFLLFGMDSLRRQSRHDDVKSPSLCVCGLICVLLL